LSPSVCVCTVRQAKDRAKNIRKRLPAASDPTLAPARELTAVFLRVSQTDRQTGRQTVGQSDRGYVKMRTHILDWLAPMACSTWGGLRRTATACCVLTVLRRRRARRAPSPPRPSIFPRLGAHRPPAPPCRPPSGLDCPSRARAAAATAAARLPTSGLHAGVAAASAGRLLAPAAAQHAPGRPIPLGGRCCDFPFVCVQALSILVCFVRFPSLGVHTKRNCTSTLPCAEITSPESSVQ
jgi:hypothetical protein